MRTKKLIYLSFIFLIAFICSCKEEKEEIPTKTRMQGVWEVTAAYDENGNDILSKIKFPVVAFSLSSDNTVVSTAGPMIMHIVYGGSNYTNIASKIDQVFNYASLSFNGGEFFVEGGLVERFTLEMKLEGLPGQKALTTLLDLLGITNDYMDITVYHKFMDVAVSFNKTNDQMTWTFDSETTAAYNKKDKYGNYILWGGWPVNNFQKCSFTLQKSAKSLTDVVKEHI